MEIVKPDTPAEEKKGEEKTNLPDAVNPKDKNKEAEKPKSRAQRRWEEKQEEQYQRERQIYDDKLIELTDKFLFEWDGSESVEAAQTLERYDQLWKMIADNHNRKKTAAIGVVRDAFMTYVISLQKHSKVDLNAPKPTMEEINAMMDSDKKINNEKQPIELSKEETDERIKGIQKTLLDKENESTGE